MTDAVALTPTEEKQSLTDVLYGMTGGRRASIPRPPSVTLDGLTGLFSIDEYDQVSGEYVTRQIPGASLDVTVLLIRSMIRWKFSEDKSAPRVWSDEWDGNGKRQVVNLRQKFQGQQATVQFTGTYEQMKAQFGVTDQMTKKETFPWDFYIVLYAAVVDGTPEGKLVRIPIKGDSRSAWFDWNKVFHQGTKDHLAERICRLGLSEKKKTGAGVEYVSMTFADVGPSPFGETVVGKIKDLKDYFAVIEGEPTYVDAPPTPRVMPAIPPPVARVTLMPGPTVTSTAVPPADESETVAPAEKPNDLDKIMAKVAAMQTEKECNEAIMRLMEDTTISAARRTLIISMLEDKSKKLRAEIDSIPF